ncbi:hypothetical protein AX14_003289, partial [Amanita brunnescens Koide BX004]
MTNSPLPEQELLLPPSSLQQAHGLQVLTEIELMLQKGQAYDALNKLWTSIHIWNYNLEFNKT